MRLSWISVLTLSVSFAFPILHAAADPIQDAREAYRQGAYAMALGIYTPLAEKGDANAQFGVGLAYAEGKGVHHDDAEALKWYRRAAKRGNVDAQVALGTMYAQGHGTEQNASEASKWYRKAAERGNVVAQFALGEAYARGKGVRQNSSEAQRWYAKAAEQGHPAAQFTLGLMYSQGKGVGRDDAEAVRWWRKAAEAGVADAQLYLGSAYHTGNGVLNSASAAVDWYYKAGVGFLKEGKRDFALVALDSINLASPDHWLGKKLQEAIYPQGTASPSPAPGGTTGDIAAGKEGVSQSTGWFAAPGIVLTSYRAIENRDDLQVLLQGGKKLPAFLVASNKVNDVALLKVQTAGLALPRCIPLARSPVEPGAKVFTIGYHLPEILGWEPRFASGEINSLKGIQDDPRFYQVHIPLQHGNSGGPLLNMNGEVVGVIAGKPELMASLLPAEDFASDLNFALKSQYLVSLLEEASGGILDQLIPGPTATIEELGKQAMESVVMVVGR